MRNLRAESAPAAGAEIQSRAGACKPGAVGVTDPVMESLRRNPWQRLHFLRLGVRMDKYPERTPELRQKIRDLCDLHGWEYPEEAGQ